MNKNITQVVKGSIVPVLEDLLKDDLNNIIQGSKTNKDILGLLNEVDFYATEITENIEATLKCEGLDIVNI